MSGSSKSSAEEPTFRVTVSAHSDVGRVRAQNEDRFLLADLTQGEVLSGDRVYEFELGPKGFVLAVADGMGGALGGEVASQMATELIFGRLKETWREDSDSDVESLRVYSRQAVEHANSMIHERSENEAELSGMGSTATVVCGVGDQIVVSQIGDSRAYLKRNGEARRLTRDQSLTQRLLDLGRITPQQAAASTQRNVILQALGPSPTLEVVQTGEAIQDGDVVMACSDGLCGVISDDDITVILDGTKDLREIGAALIKAANAKGGPDNITVVLARFRRAP